MSPDGNTPLRFRRAIEHCETQTVSSVNFRDACRFDDRRLALPLGKVVCLYAICIDPRKLLSVSIEDSDAVVTMFPSLVFLQGRLATFFSTLHLRTLSVEMEGFQ